MQSHRTKTLKSIGIMSGSSMDGVDIALCEFQFDNEKVHYQIIQATTFQYPSEIFHILLHIRTSSAKDFFLFDTKYGQWLGKKISTWMKKHNLTADIIALHGHTVFHHPELGFSIQLGNASHIAAICCIPVVHNFRNNDIAAGGQGAPLVPIGDKILFSRYDACINIGGIANVFKQNNNQAYDIGIANIALNYFAKQIGKNYDKNGKIAKSGKTHDGLLKQLNQLNFFHQSPPKSLNREYFEKEYMSVLKKHHLPVPDVLRTLTEHIAIQIARSVSDKHIKNILITGGGAFNHFLIERITAHCPNKNIIVPDKTLVKFKEALIFALLGCLRLLEKHGNI
ncbi:MAG: anhydro-N-acetylmuramic acid kinase, partial [Bacteroidia bacterium]|nr:anhydro-N-acetylmuramic acid kinase [Bacteroidia bacterium]